MALAKLVKSRVDVGTAMRARVTTLFRQVCRELPRIAELYELPYTASELRHLVGIQFRRHMNVHDPRVIDMLVTKGEMELEETLKQWKQRPHVIELLDLTDRTAAEASIANDEAMVKNRYITGEYVMDVIRAAEAAAGVAHDAARAEQLRSFEAEREFQRVTGDYTSGAAVEPGVYEEDGIKEAVDRFRKNGVFETADELKRRVLQTPRDMHGSVPGEQEEEVQLALSNNDELSSFIDRATANEPNEHEQRQRNMFFAASRAQLASGNIREHVSPEVRAKRLPLHIATKLHHTWADEAIRDHYRSAADLEKDTDLSAPERNLLRLMHAVEAQEAVLFGDHEAAQLEVDALFAELRARHTGTVIDA